MKVTLLFLCFFFSLQKERVWADSQEKVLAGFDAKVDLISEKYEAGEYLIYDCEDYHWVCVREPFYLECQEKRKEDADFQKVTSRCAAVGKFPTKKSCFQRQLYMATHNFGNSFCALGEWKHREILFR
jgi:hypothetical protein